MIDTLSVIEERSRWIKESSKELNQVHKDNIKPVSLDPDWDTESPPYSPNPITHSEPNLRKPKSTQSQVYSKTCLLEPNELIVGIPRSWED